MKLLIITQKVDINDDVLGFFHRWLEEFAKHCEKVTVICLEMGEYNLPDNVKVLSLGKEEQLRKIKYIFRFYKYIWQERKKYDAVFVHMNPEYVILGGLFWKAMGKKVALWYTHKAVNLKLRLAEKLTDIIFTPSKESFKLKTNKLQIVGHGIPVELFKNPQLKNYNKGDKLKIISVGRITKIKNLDTLIKAGSLLNKKDIDFEISLIGPVVGEEDKKYLEYLERLILENNLNKKIKFLGSVPNNKIAEYYWQNNLSVNLAPTGGVDKVVLESMSSGVIALASNLAMEEYFGKYKNDILFKERDEKDLVDKIMNLISRDDLEDIKNFLFYSAKEKTDLKNLILKITDILNEVNFFKQNVKK